MKTQLDIKCIVEHLSECNLLYVLDFRRQDQWNKHVTKPKNPKHYFNNIINIKRLINPEKLTQKEPKLLSKMSNSRR